MNQIRPPMVGSVWRVTGSYLRNNECPVLKPNTCGKIFTGFWNQRYSKIHCLWLALVREGALYLVQLIFNFRPPMLVVVWLHVGYAVTCTSLKLEIILLYLTRHCGRSVKFRSVHCTPQDAPGLVSRILSSAIVEETCVGALTREHPFCLNNSYKWLLPVCRRRDSWNYVCNANLGRNRTPNGP